MTEKAQRTVHIKWVRSGIGFTYRQKGMVRSLGLRRLHQVVERPDTAQIRGLVARIPHLVEIISDPPRPPAWAAIPEYTLTAPVVSPPEAPPAVGEVAPLSAQPEAPVAAAEGAAEPAVAKKAEPHAPAKAKKAAKTAKASQGKGKAGKETAKKKAQPVAGKSAKSPKPKKK